MCLSRVRSLCGHRSSYLASAWNWIDCVVVVSGLVTLAFSGDSIVSSLRLIRMLRPLRSIQRIRGMRVLVQCLMEAMPQICNVAVFLVFFLTMLALFGNSRPLTRNLSLPLALTCCA